MLRAVVDASGENCQPKTKKKTRRRGEAAEQPSFFDKKNDGSGAAYKQSEGGSEAGSSPKGNYQREEASRSSPISGPAAPVFRPSTHTCVVGHKIGFMGGGSALPRRHISARTSARFFFYLLHSPSRLRAGCERKLTKNISRETKKSAENREG